MTEIQRIVDRSRHAILIGINDYKTRPLKYSVNDVGLLRDGLINHCRFAEDQIHSIESCQLYPVEEIRKKFFEKIMELKEKIEPDSVVFFYFSGHGIYLDKSHLLFHETEVSIQEIYDALNAFKPKNQCYVIDACYSGGDIEFKSSMEHSAEYSSQWLEARSEGVHLYCASKSTELSMGLSELKHGVYTYNFVKAMSLHALYDEELETLSLNELHFYAIKRILIDYDQRQTPFQYSKASGYFPFCFIEKPHQLANLNVDFPKLRDEEVSKIINDPALNLPEVIKMDLINFLNELLSNLYDHNRSKSVDLKIYDNIIELLDYSRGHFNPFEAEPIQGGNGIVVYRLFLEKYDKWIKTSYTPGDPNIIRMEFNPEILDYRSVNPCHIQIKELILLNIRNLNAYEFDQNCSEIVIDISKSNSPLSFIVRHLFEYLLKHTLDTQLIVLKMHPEDMQRDYVKKLVSQEKHLERILVI